MKLKHGLALFTFFTIFLSMNMGQAHAAKLDSSPKMALGTFVGLADMHSFEMTVKGKSLMIRFEDEVMLKSADEGDLVLITYQTNKYQQHVLVKTIFVLRNNDGILSIP